MSVFLLIIGLVLFIGLVVVHEFGHFILARRNGVIIEEFGIGFPPRAWSRKTKGGWIFSLNWLPFGGFVRLKGEHDSDMTKGSYGASPLKAKTKIMLAGVAMNLLTAAVLLTLLALVGMPKILDDQFTVTSDTKVTSNSVLVGSVEDGSPAAQAGLQPQDQLIGITGSDGVEHPITDAATLPEITKLYAGQKIILLTTHDRTSRQIPIQLRTTAEVEESKKTSSPMGYLGVVSSEYTLRRSTWSAPIVAVGFIGQITQATFVGIGRAVSGLVSGNTAQASNQVSGPVGIFALLKDGSLLGYPFVLLIVAIISLTLAIMNVLPIPALDGGRLFVTLLFRTMRRPLKQKTEEWIHGTGFVVLMLLFALITVVDVRRFF